MAYPKNMGSIVVAGSALELEAGLCGKRPGMTVVVRAHGFDAVIMPRSLGKLRRNRGVYSYSCKRDDVNAPISIKRRYFPKQ